MKLRRPIQGSPTSWTEVRGKLPILNSPRVAICLSLNRDFASFEVDTDTEDRASSLSALATVADHSHIRATCRFSSKSPAGAARGSHGI